MPLCLCGLFLLLGCQRGPQPPPADLPPGPGYQRVKPAGLSFSVDLPRAWRVARTEPGRARLRQPTRPGLLFQLSELAPPGKGPKGGWKLDAAEERVLSSLRGPGGHSLQILSREDQRTAWLPGRLIQAREPGKKPGRLWAVWIAIHHGRAYALAAAGPAAAQLELRETLDHASATLRPGE